MSPNPNRPPMAERQHRAEKRAHIARLPVRKPQIGLAQEVATQRLCIRRRDARNAFEKPRSRSSRVTLGDPSGANYFEPENFQDPGGSGFLTVKFER